MVDRYAQAGVDIDVLDALKEGFKTAVEATYNDAVLSKLGSFGGLFSLAKVTERYQHPVLCASVDGIGTKVKIGRMMNRYRGLGLDLVNHSINDILVQGAEPLFFLDYLAFGTLNEQAAIEIVEGIAIACCYAGCALIKGETAVMPGIYLPTAFDVAGMIVGVVEKDEILPKREAIRQGDLLFGLPSSGPHTNGYSLIRDIFKPEEYRQRFDELGGELLGEVLLTPHRNYLYEIKHLRERVEIKALAHITGGGFVGNIPRVLPRGMGFKLLEGAWKVPPIFKLIQSRGEIASQEMYRVFNMGIGMVIVVAQHNGCAIQSALPEARHIGYVI